MAAGFKKALATILITVLLLPLGAAAAATELHYEQQYEYEGLVIGFDENSAIGLEYEREQPVALTGSAYFTDAALNPVKNAQPGKTYYITVVPLLRALEQALQTALPAANATKTLNAVMAPAYAQLENLALDVEGAGDAIRDISLELFEFEGAEQYGAVPAIAVTISEQATQAEISFTLQLRATQEFVFGGRAYTTDVASPYGVLLNMLAKSYTKQLTEAASKWFDPFKWQTIQTGRDFAADLAAPTTVQNFEKKLALQPGSTFTIPVSITTTNSASPSAYEYATARPGDEAIPVSGGTTIPPTGESSARIIFYFLAVGCLLAIGGAVLGRQRSRR